MSPVVFLVNSVASPDAKRFQSSPYWAQDAVSCGCRENFTDDPVTLGSTTSILSTIHPALQVSPRTVAPIDADDHYRFYPPKGWHSAGVSPGFCSQLCADGWALLESDAEKFRERRRKEILKDNAEFSHPRNED